MTVIVALARAHLALLRAAANKKESNSAFCKCADFSIRLFLLYFPRFKREIIVAASRRWKLREEGAEEKTRLKIVNDGAIFFLPPLILESLNGLSGNDV